MKTQSELGEAKKVAEKAIQRWENEGGEVPEIARLKSVTVIEERLIAESENQAVDE